MESGVDGSKLFIHSLTDDERLLVDEGFEFEPDLDVIVEHDPKYLAFLTRFLPPDGVHREIAMTQAASLDYERYHLESGKSQKYLDGLRRMEYQIFQQLANEPKGVAVEGIPWLKVRYFASMDTEKNYFSCMNFFRETARGIRIVRLLRKPVSRKEWKRFSDEFVDRQP